MVDRKKKWKKILLVSIIILFILIFIAALPFVILAIGWSRMNAPRNVEDPRVLAMISEIEAVDYVHRIQSGVSRDGTIRIDVFVYESFTVEHRIVIMGLHEKYSYTDEGRRTTAPIDIRFRNSSDGSLCWGGFSLPERL
ncbi:MAG: hypothetical protein FWF78_04185 [Defluviitaleaceae bacterium]|nr:hypothetical protein [Defluviitaleaceae bacterium]